MPKLNVIGAGRVGRTLAAVFQRGRVFEVQDVLSASVASSSAAVAFIGAGRAVAALPEMRAADVWLVSTPDRAIASECANLAATDSLRPNDIVFHCSGALSSAELATAAANGARVASVHPLKTFANPEEAVATFAGTPCVAEGDGEALATLRAAFERVGARVLDIASTSKTLYHAASVIVCNYLVALLDTGLRCYEEAGIERDAALKLIEPIVRETIDHVFELGPARALTGPISRGDAAIVARHLEALAALDPQAEAVYRSLGVAAVAVAQRQGAASPPALDAIAALLRKG